MVSLRTSKNSKVIATISLESVNFYAHRNYCIGKKARIVVTSYFLRNNGIFSAKKLVPFLFTRSGKIAQVSNDFLKKVYKEDGEGKHVLRRSSVDRDEYWD